MSSIEVRGLWIATSPVVRYGRVKEEDKILGEEALFSEETISGEGHISEPQYHHSQVGGSECLGPEGGTWMEHPSTCDVGHFFIILTPLGWLEKVD